MVESERKIISEGENQEQLADNEKNIDIAFALVRFFHLDRATRGFGARYTLHCALINARTSRAEKMNMELRSTPLDDDKSTFKMRQAAAKKMRK